MSINTPEFLVVIPARLGSTRLPRKPLADIGGKPMVIRVAERAQQSHAQSVVVATDSPEIQAACDEHRIECLLTSADHPTGTDRIAEVAQLLKLPADTLVVNVQGDEPLIPPELINQVAQTLAEASDAMGEDIAKLIHEGPKEALGLTTNTQPVMLVSAVAAYRAWLAEGGAVPSVVAGHSLGEYSALVASGVLTLAQAAPLVRFRAQAMQEAVPVGTGAMAAILGLPADKVIAGCAEAHATFGAGSAEVERL